MGPARASLAYGAVLGFGLLTRINSPAFYLVPAAAVIAPSAALALIPAGLFGLARGTIVVGRSAIFRRQFSRDAQAVIEGGFSQRLLLLPLQVIFLVAIVLEGGASLLTL